MAFNKFLAFYDEVDSIDLMNRVILDGKDRNPQHYLLKLKDAYRPNMIRAGYS